MIAAGQVSLQSPDLARLMLFEPARHEPLAGAAWDPVRVREAIRTIASEIERGRDGLWPPHPLDQVPEERPKPFKTLYLGAAGVVWALWYLHREGAIPLALDLRTLIATIDDAYRADPDTDTFVPSYFIGEVGILLVRWRLSGEPAVADRLWTAVHDNMSHPANEAFWAAPGTMLAAVHMLAWTGEPRWRELVVDNIAQLWRTWQLDDRVGCHLWTQDLDGRIDQVIGAGHGFAGNVYALLRTAELDPARRPELDARCFATLQALAVVEGDAINWRQGLTPPRPGRPELLVQWCHGAPGIVTALADGPRTLDPLLIGAGTTIWNAGPLAKGYGLCHGTAGNGYAFLKLHRRTGDPMWLSRARSFAMHALSQYEAKEGPGRYSLWTGDAGLAVYLWHCVTEADGLPTLDLM
ncbi:MAG: LanC-like protein [Kofleriaceae bacterium]